MSNTVKVTTSDFTDSVLKSEVPVLVDFWAPWCGPCRQMEPILEELADELSEQVVIAKLNVDENPVLASKFGIVSIPTMMLFKDGQPVRSMVGGRPKSTLKKELEALM
ncbi:MAG: thioredoxin [Actinomycetaceae bacterium]|nr:thioredoxin [Actinomycetaceae bacterium]